MKLKGQTALITGASRGIGEPIARALAPEGAQVAITGQAFNIDGGFLMV